MKKNLFITFISFASAALAAAALDKGGVTFDFQKISDRFNKPAAAVSQAENLVTNADGSKKEDPKDYLRWQPNYTYLHTNAIPGKDPRRARAREVVKWSVKNGVFSVSKPDEAKSFLTPKLVQSYSGGWRKTVNLPHAKGGLYKVSFEYRGKLTTPGSSCIIISGNTETAGRWWKGKTKFFKVYPFKMASEWQYYQETVSLAPGIRSIELVPRFNGLGTLEFRKMAVTPAKAAENEKITLLLSPMGRLDQTFALAQNLPGTVNYIWKRNCAPKDLKLKRPRLVVVMPREVTFNAAANLKYLGQTTTPRGIEHRIDLTPWKRRPESMGSFDNYLRISMMISTQAAPGTKLAPGSSWVEDEGKRISNIVRVNYTVIPEFKAAKPEIFLPGIYTGGIYMNYKAPQEMAFNAKMFDAAGVRWIIAGHTPSFPYWRKAGVKVITPELFYIANGYRVGPPEGRPEADKYRAIGNLHKEEIERSTCPAAVYEKRPFFLKTAVPYIQKSLAGADGLWANWEPYFYAGRGCFCDGCRKKFAEFAGVSEEQMKKEWPQELAVGRKYYKQAVKFRSLEHAKLMNTLNGIITQATGGKGKSFGFVPGIQIDTMSSTWKEHGFDKETHPIDYADNFEWVDPWGPYAFWHAHKSYVYDKGYSLRVFLKAKDVSAAVKRDYKRPPKLLAFPHGHQGLDWVTQPESMAMDILSFMFNQWRAATVYIFPKGYDARYWKAFANASDIAARYEKFVFKGKRADEKVSLIPQAPYASKTVIFESLLGTFKYHDMLQHTAYELNGSLIVAAFNFWRNGEVFFTLKVKGVSPDTRYTVKSRDTRFTAKGGKSFTGRELAAGVTLHAGAVRCAVYEIAPEKAADKKLPVFTADDMKKAQLKARAELLKAKAADDEYTKRNLIRETELADISNAGIVGKADNRSQTLLFTSGKNSALFIARSSCVSKWSVNGKSVIHGNTISGMGGVAFWLPSMQMRNGCVIKEQKKIPGGIEIVTEKLILDRDDPQLSGLTIRQRVQLTDKLTRISVKTSIINNTVRSISFGVRYNMMPAFPAVKGGFTRIVSNGKAIDFKRDMNRALYTTGIDKVCESAVRKLFAIKTPNREINPGEFYFLAPGAQAQLFITPRDALAGVAVWDEGRQLAGTFEPCFKYMTLSPGGTSFNFSAVMKVSK